MPERIAQAQEKVTQVAQNLRAQKPVESVIGVVNERLPKFQAMKSKVSEFIGGLKTEVPVPPSPEDSDDKKGSDRVKEAMGRASETLAKVKDNVGDKLGPAKENVTEKVGSVKEKVTDKAGPAKEAVLDKVSSAKEAVGTSTTKTVEWFNDEEEGTKRKTVAAVGVLGVVTLAAAYGVYRKRKGSEEEPEETTPDEPEVLPDDEKRQMQARIAELEARLPKDGHKTTSESIAEMRALIKGTSDELEEKGTIKKGPIYRFGDKLNEADGQAASPSRTREAADRARAHLAGNRDGDTQTQSTHTDSEHKAVSETMEKVGERTSRWRTERAEAQKDKKLETKKQKLAHGLGKVAFEMGLTAYTALEMAKIPKRAHSNRNNQPAQSVDPNATAPTEPLPVTPPPAPAPEAARHTA